MKKIDLEQLVIIEESVDNWTGIFCFGPGADGVLCGFGCTSGNVCIF